MTAVAAPVGTVARTCWLATGSITPDAARPAVADTRCAFCGTDVSAGDLVVPTKSAISKSFTDFDAWTNPSGRWLCPPCAWTLGTVVLRRDIRLVTTDLDTRVLTPHALHHLLVAGALPGTMAVLVPTGMARQHLLPQAQWGRVTVAEAALPWTDHTAELVDAMYQLRRYGFHPSDLAKHAPPYNVMKTISPGLWPQIMTDWSVLDEWRAPSSPYWELALKASQESA